MQRALMMMVALVAVTGCGPRYVPTPTPTPDYRQDFLNPAWRGNDTVVVQSFAGTQFSPYAVTVGMTKLGSDGLTITGFECSPMTATATTSTHFNLDNNDTTDCVISDAENTGCNFRFTYDVGGASYGDTNGATLVFHGQGSYAAACTNGSTDSGGFTEDATLN